MEGGDGRVYKETVYRPKDTKERAVRKRRMILIGVAIILVIALLALIIGIAVNKSKHRDTKALRSFPGGDGKPVKFIQGTKASSQPYIDSLQTLLLGYEDGKQESEHFMDCSNGEAPPPHTDGVCRFHVDTLGGECTKDRDFGYSEGMPCFILQLTPPKDWQPSAFSNASYPADLPPASLSSDHVPVHCKPSMDEMKDLIAEILIFPIKGFPSVFFSNPGQEDYRAPLVAVQVRPSNMGNGQLIMITCSVLDPSLDKENNQDFITDIYFQVD